MGKFVLGSVIYGTAMVLAGAGGFLTWNEVFDTVVMWMTGFATGLYLGSD